jgi:putative DNA primase/helicase
VTETICIAEGYATGASIHEATGYHAIVAFDAGNLLSVAEAIRAKHPAAKIILCADDDAETEGNPGLTAATRAAKAVRGLLAIPSFGKRDAVLTDFNDMANDQGLEAVKARIEAATKPAQGEAVAPDAIIAPAGEYRFSESEAARRFGDIIRDRARFVADEGQWYYFDGQRWTKDHSSVWMLEQSPKESRSHEHRPHLL